ncbi:MAG: hypothetical protein HYX42_20900 [Polaromonas sp.]|uniref:hypothetical protein n=1 Tax=Polaromonas sp. TaxID=1869339 RepID=UPI0025D4DB20|nr:hypothetical protein [Polaromonas sp.]MBI2728706.1 hypothetical protein [Polaromonas sp.]
MDGSCAWGEFDKYGHREEVNKQRKAFDATENPFGPDPHRQTAMQAGRVMV